MGELNAMTKVVHPEGCPAWPALFIFNKVGKRVEGYLFPLGKDIWQNV